jgi:hypothetical protein
MAFWNRSSKNQSGISKELEEYYQTERRERVGVAWLLALGTLVTTLVLAAALFFGGKWVWQRFSDDSPSSDVTTTDDSPENGSQLTIDDTPVSANDTNAMPGSALQPTPTPAPTTSTSTTLPRTGPDEDL